MGGVYYFAYGSNMNSARMNSRGVDYLNKQRGILHNWKLVFNKQSKANPQVGFANIIPSPESQVEGVIYEIKVEDLEKLCKFEGYPKHYNLHEKEIINDQGLVIKAFVFIAQPDKQRSGLKPTSEYLSHLLAGREFLSEMYYLELVSQETLE